MKIIDLLNKIANGEEVPKVISYPQYYKGNIILTYDEETKDYYNEPSCTYALFDNINVKLNDEINIISEEYQNYFDDYYRLLKRISKALNILTYEDLDDFDKIEEVIKTLKGDSDD